MNETTQSIDIETLRRMPKPSIDHVVTSIRAQALSLTKFSVLLLLLALCLYGLSEFWQEDRRLLADRLEIAALALAVVVLPGVAICAVVWWLWEWSQSKKWRKLAGGDYYVHWTYPSEQWQAFCQKHEETTSRLTSTITLSCAVLGLLVALAVHLDNGDLLLSSLILHYGILGSGGAVIGLLAGMYCTHLSQMTNRLRSAQTAQAIIGPAGVYLTGQFLPAESFDRQLKRVFRSPEAPETLVFRVQIQTKYGPRDTDAEVPIPHGQDATADALIEMYREQFGMIG